MVDSNLQYGGGIVVTDTTYFALHSYVNAALKN